MRLICLVFLFGLVTPTLARPAETAGRAAHPANDSRTATESGETVEGGSKGSLEEVVVTAQKRGDERLQDVPVPISVLSADSLLEGGDTGLQDYFSSVPGLAVTSGLGGTSTIVIRGVSTNGLNDNPTVGVTIDDAPYGASTFFGGGLQPIELDPNDIRQIEVLRGPQGTLYGASSLGGLLRYVTIDPAPDKLSGRVVLSTQRAQNADGLDYGMRGALNAPISEGLAVRISASDQHYGGFIDDAVGGRQGVNDGRSYGGRTAVLWRTSDNWTVRFNAVRQVSETGAANVVDISKNDSDVLKTSDYVPGSTGMERSVTFLSGRIDGMAGGISLASITAYTDADSLQKESITRGVLHDVATALGGDVALYSNSQRGSKFSQELRAEISLGDRITWLVGAFYTEEDGHYREPISAGLRSAGEVVGDLAILDAEILTSYKEAAAFTNLTVNFTPRLDVQFGGRVSENRQQLTQTSTGFLVGGGEVVLGPNKSKDQSFTYSVTPRYKFNDDVMIYGRVATGYRAGGPTFNSDLPGAPKTLVADTTENYEVGVKAALFDRFISVDASIYYIDWKDIPTMLTDVASGRGFNINAGGALSRGAELSLTARPLEELTLSAWGAWSKAYINELPDQYAAPYVVGDRLPFSPRFAANAALEYRYPVFESATGSIQAAYRYIGDRCSRVGSSDKELPSYSQFDLTAVLGLGSWNVSAYVNNVTNERGRIGPKGLDGIVSPIGAYLIIRPRTIGMSLARQF